MSRTPFDNDNQAHYHGDALDRAVAEVLSEPLDERRIEEAAQRVWSRLNAPAAAASAGAAGSIELSGCGNDLARDIPAWARGELSAARVMLLEDHARECLPCRRALLAARQGRVGGMSPAAAAGGQRAPWFGPLPAAGETPVRRWFPLAAAALLAVGVGLAVTWSNGGWPWVGAAQRLARVEVVEGQLLQVSGATSVPVAAGDVVVRGEQLRTAKTSRAVLRLDDGSRVEMAERAGLSLAADRGGSTIDLERGRIIVQAAHAAPGRHLVVAAADCRVAVTGTIFEVNHGIKGSRVSAIEGEVRVESAGYRGSGGGRGVPMLAVLRGGQQMATHESVAAVPVRDEIAWSRDAARYNALLAALPSVTAAAQALDAQIPAPALRSTSPLLDLVPAGTLFYVALPNLSANLLQAEQSLEQRLADDPALAAWWSQTLGSPQAEAQLDALIQEIGVVGGYLGPEVVIAAGAETDGDGSGSGSPFANAAPVLLSTTTEEAALRATLAQQVAVFNQHAGRTALVLLSTLPAATAGQGAGTSSTFYLWVGNGLLVASPSQARIAVVGAAAAAGAAAANPFVASSFHTRLAQAYGDGVGCLFGVDLQHLVTAHTASGAAQLAASGLADLQHFIIERHDVTAPGAPVPAVGGVSGGGTATQAVVTFSQARRGIASWLAAPAPMGSLGYFSQDTSLVAAFVVKSPVALLADLTTLSPSLAAGLAKAEAEHGFNLHDDLAAPLGGEVALGLDGPLVPTPSWKLVVEVYDPVRLQQTFTDAVERMNAELTAQGKPGVTLSPSNVGGQTYYTVAAQDQHLSLCYVFADGYLVAAPNSALVTAALAAHAAGTTLAASPNLKGLLDRDGQVNLSAVVYQNLAPLASALGPLAGAVGGAGSAAAAGGGMPDGIGGLLLGLRSGPSLLYAYGEADRIVVGGRGQAGPMGRNLSILDGFASIIGHIDQARGVAGGAGDSGHARGSRARSDASPAGRGVRGGRPTVAVLAAPAERKVRRA